MISLTLALLIAAVALQVYDAWSTIKILREGGRESKPLIRKLMELIGVAPAMILKAILISGLFVYAAYLGLSGAVDIKFVAGGLAITIVGLLVIFSRCNFKHDGIGKS